MLRFLSFEKRNDECKNISTILFFHLIKTILFKINRFKNDFRFLNIVNEMISLFSEN